MAKVLKDIRNKNEEVNNYVHFPQVSKEDASDQPQITILSFKKQTCKIPHNWVVENYIKYKFLKSTKKQLQYIFYHVW